MKYSASTHTDDAIVGQVIVGFFVAGVMFILGYTVVRVSLAEADGSLAANDGADVQVVVPGEGTLWADFGPSH